LILKTIKRIQTFAEIRGFFEKQSNEFKRSS